jgi:predicted acetylornithine/succinylornithine family transaminase
VCALGHSHPRLARVLADQAETLLHTSNLYFNEKQVLAAQRLVEHAFPGRVFFCNSGAEANEAALKLSRRYQHARGEDRRDRIVAMEGSFHGRSIATVSVTGQEKYRQGFGPLFAPVTFVPYGDFDAVKNAVADRRACAVLVEPIQGEGGVIVPPPGYLQKLRTLCTETGTLLLFDEVQTGIGRTGKWFGHQWDGVLPDAMSLAKGLGGGVPVGALVATEEVAKGLAFADGVVPHASTFGGNPLATAAILAVIDIIESEQLIENCVVVGNYLEKCLQQLIVKRPSICKEVRGRGLLRGLLLDRPPAPLVTTCREQGLLLSAAGSHVLRFAPALTVQTAHVDEAVEILDRVLGGLHG